MQRGSYLAVILGAAAFTVLIRQAPTGAGTGQETVGRGRPPLSRSAPLFHVGQNVRVSTDRPTATFAEVTLAADPKHASRLLAASMYRPKGGRTYKIAVYASQDGGRKWSSSLDRAEKDPISYYDPAFAYAADGNACFVDMRAYGGSFSAGEKESSLQFARTQNNGRSWSEAAPISGMKDRPWLAVDNSGANYRGRLYCKYLGGLIFSTDQAGMFQPARTYAVLGGTPGGGNVVTMSNGTVVALSTNTRLSMPDKPNTILAVSCSTDGGETFGRAVAVAPPYRYNVMTLPCLAAGPRDNLYVIWSHELTTGGSGIFFARSGDRGVTWSAPMLLSEQTPEGDTARGSSYSTVVGSLAVNGSGVLGVLWYDTRGLPKAGSGWNVRFRASLDGGKSWEPSLCISEKRTYFPDGYAQSTIGAAGGFPPDRPGDTSGLTADAEGTFHALWIDGRTGVWQLWTCPISVNHL